MESSFLDVVIHHWRFLAILWILVNSVNSMPSPNGEGMKGSLGYKWLFSTLHGTFGMLPRLFKVIFPQAAAVVDEEKTKAAGQGN